MSQPISTELLLNAYSRGWFPMSDSRHDNEVHWYQPTIRGVIPIDGFHMSKNVMRLIRRGGYEVSIDLEFERVMRMCAERDETWISEAIIEAYTRLQVEGFAHSIEIWRSGDLVGGLYGVSIRRAFFGESMFHTEPEMDKVALWYCHDFLSKAGYTLWDTQYYTEHLGRFGCVEMDHKTYMKHLKTALAPSVAPK